MRKFGFLSQSLLATVSLANISVTSAVSAQSLQSQPIPVTIVSSQPASAPAVIVARPVDVKPQMPAKPEIAEIKAQTAIALTPVQIVNVKKLKIGDRIELVTMVDTQSEGKTLITKGTKAFATVTEALGARAFGRGGQVTLKFGQLQPVMGEAIQLSGTYTETGGRGDTQTGANLGATGAALAGSFGAIGALAGLFGSALVKGRSVVLNPGKTLTAFTTQTLRLAPDGITLAIVAPEVSTPSAAVQPSAITLPDAKPASPAASPLLQ